MEYLKRYFFLTYLMGLMMNLYSFEVIQYYIMMRQFDQKKQLQCITGPGIKHPCIVIPGFFNQPV